MKWVIVILVGLSGIECFGQCDSLVQTRIDDITGKTRYEFIKSLEGDAPDKSIALYVKKDKGAFGTEMYFIFIGAGECVDKDSKVHFLFKDGSRYTAKNKYGFNCKKTSLIPLLGPYQEGDQNFDELTSKRIAKFRAHSYDGYVEVELSDDESEQILKAIKCIHAKP